jgi:succinoglycan biosynthesis protein ExoA
MTTTKVEDRPVTTGRAIGAKELPFVTIAMPCFNEEDYIEACLRSVLAQDYPPDRFEVLVADGRSDDRTREILAKLAEQDARIRVIDNPERLQAAGMNRAIREARGRVIVRMDVHCEYARDYVSACVRVLREQGAANVGGAQRARAHTPFQRALCAALASPLGVGGARYRSPHEEGDVDTVFLGAFDRRIFERAGLYDPRAFTNEDAELNQRILAAGGRVYLSREIEVAYYPRRSLRALARQYYRYGLGRARTLLIHRRLPSVRPVVPLFMVSAATLGVALPPLWPVALIGGCAYAGLTFAEAVRVAWRLGPLGIARAWVIFPVLHGSHGVGFAAGLWRFARRPDWSEPERLAAEPEHVPLAAARGR